MSTTSKRKKGNSPPSIVAFAPNVTIKRSNLSTNDRQDAPDLNYSHLNVAGADTTIAFMSRMTVAGLEGVVSPRG